MDLWLIDAFTTRPFRGNPAGVCLLHDPRPDAWMQALAAEMNQAETAFLLRGDDGFGLRWFTPLAEVDLCGHATLASAYFLWQEGHLKPRAEARFHTKSGLLTARQRDDGAITLNFPATPADPAPAPNDLLSTLGLAQAAVLKSKFDYLVVADSAAEVRRLAPDPTRLAQVQARGVIVTAPGDEPGLDFVSRFFAPAVGVDEDPVTGSAHCALGPYWGGRLGKRSLVGFQASARGGTVLVDLKDDRVLLSGHAVAVVKGTLNDDGA
jgi:PhzF family phenazine biosynthesis protein